MRTFKKIIRFLVAHWARVIKTAIALYLMTIGVSLLAGAGTLGALTLPSMAITLPT